MPALDPSICCPDCISVAVNGGRAADFSCPVCCVRNLMQMIELMGTYGTAGHADRIKDLLVETLVREA